ncbi:MAG: DEAD/DEAH box helicase family protein [Bdellovibrionales bacterium]|nr:DEAD/DEAH box helicase family protein [Opitutaceae bacterium]MCC7441194.1 DEAD/DEAH box helicase family protein [Bdellovibrionales bacterium]
MNAGTRVLHKQHPEYGFGVVRYDEDNVLGERRLQVSFDHVDALLELAPEAVVEVAHPEQAAQAGEWGKVETLRTQLLAALVIAENNATSAFIKTTTRPLPHQVSVLDKITSGERFGHLCADDVGLGKTIEAGLLITHALASQKSSKVLIVCPAGVALQWQDEMEEHFSLYFSVLGIDFKGTLPAQWRNHFLVIAPIDRLKQPHYETVLREAGPFDLIVCDEAHRLNASRNRLTESLEKTKSYRLFERLIAEKTVNFVTQAGAPRSPRMLFLSATPHQGDDVRFLYLLHLLRPDLFPIENEDLAPLSSEQLREVVTRTPKALARDWEGVPIFKGHSAHTIDVPWTVQETAISRLLSAYIRKSLSASSASGKPNALVVELVMHTFHKIAASSWRALQSTLRHRLELLAKRRSGFAAHLDADGEDTGDTVNFSDEEMEGAFFEEEIISLQGILSSLDRLDTDSKWQHCRDLLLGLDQEQANCKVLFFTQFRATQDYLYKQLLALFPGSGVEIVNGDVPLQDRRLARRRFEAASRFMISTEAGGEGVNLQRACHIMVNYDLPWNPMRVQQRIGRLDRYGQKNRVSVFNLRVPDSWDARISTRIEERLAVIQRTMGHVVSADVENYRDMILGHVADKIDPRSAFKDHLHGGDIPVEQVDRFLREAIDSMERWKKRFGEGLTPDLDSTKFATTLTPEDFKLGYSAALQTLGLPLQESRNSRNQFISDVFHFTLPVEFRDPQIRPHREFYVVFRRDVYQRVRDEDLGTVKGQPIRANLAGFGESFTDWLFQQATAARPNASAYQVRAPANWKHGSGWLAVYTLRFLGASRCLLAPDSVVPVWLPDSGPPHVLPTPDVFALCQDASESVRRSNEVPPLSGALTLARECLKARLAARPNHSSSSISLTLWSLTAVHTL